MAPAAVGQAVGGGCQSGWGRLLSVTNAIEAGTWLGVGWAPWRREGGIPPFQCIPWGGGGGAGGDCRKGPVNVPLGVSRCAQLFGLLGGGRAHCPAPDGGHAHSAGEGGAVGTSAPPVLRQPPARAHSTAGAGSLRLQSSPGGARAPGPGASAARRGPEGPGG